MWLVSAIERHSPVADLMRTAWAWPIAESLHFLGLCLLVGAIGSFDLRLLGVARSVPIAAVHRLIPWGLLGFAINVASGLLFVLTEPDQYIYNPSFHLKVLFLGIAGVNASLFYVTSFRQVFGRLAVARRAAPCEGHRLRLALRLVDDHRLRPDDHLLSARTVRRRSRSDPDVRSRLMGRTATDAPTPSRWAIAWLSAGARTGPEVTLLAEIRRAATAGVAVTQDK